MAGRQGNPEEFVLCDIAWNDDGGRRDRVVFSEHDWSDVPEVDELVFFSGYSAGELEAAVGRPEALGEDFTVTAVHGAAPEIGELP